MSVYLIKPEVAGGLGPRTVMDRTTHPPRVDVLDHEFADWLGDDLLETYPCFVVTQRLGDLLAASDLTGYRLDDVIVSTTDQFPELHPGPLPVFHRLRVTGTPHTDDMWLDDRASLHVDDAALTVLRRARLAHAVIETVG